MGAPQTLAVLSKSETDEESQDLFSFFERFGIGPPWYGAGKAAFRDLLAATGATDGTVLLPAYLPDAVGEPVADLGLDPVYYAIEPDLGPDFAHLDTIMDDRTVAVLSVNYFGFPQPDHDRIAARTAEYDCIHVEDNAHGPISVADGDLLGTRADCGFSSLWKLLPVPNGAVVSITDPTLADRFDPSTGVGVNHRYEIDDVRFLCESLAAGLIERHRTLKRSYETLRTGGRHDPATISPRVRYDRSLRPMSKLTYRALETNDPETIREARRANYRAWERYIEGCPSVQPMIADLPTGICPQVYPVRVADSTAVVNQLIDRGVFGAHSWPRLPPDVRSDPTYETARTLSREVVALPVHQYLNPIDIDSLEPLEGH